METVQLITRVEILPNITLVGEEQFCRIYGYTKDRINERIKAGSWMLGNEYVRDGRSRLFNLGRIEEWIRKQNQGI